MAEDAEGGRTARRDRLAARRRAVGLTQEDLAALLGVERSTVVRWEAGATRPLPWIRLRLAEALHVPAGQLAELLDATTQGDPDRRESAAPVPRQLPAAVADFTGRAGELAALTRTLEQAGAGAAGTVVISAIGGTAGVGKTALAVHWAHQVADRFPDGQLYVNLRGFDPTGTPVTLAEAVRGFLDGLGVPPERIPRQRDAQVGLFRSLLANKRMLIVLDNASDEEQVRPLLPASPASLVLITSRSPLAGLATGGARLLSLYILPHHEAVQLLTARIGHARAAADPEAVGEIAELCACLPLALAVAAARAAARPAFLLTHLAAELRNAAGRLDALDIGDPAVSVRAVFSWSYRQLSPPAARMFRLLGLHPGPDISVPAVASLAGVGEPEAQRTLRELARTHLITEHIPGRYALHDLLRAYAAAQARADDSEAERGKAIGRTLDHYLHTAVHGYFLIDPGEEAIALAPPRPGTAPEQPADYRQARAWFEAEHQVLPAAIALALESGFDGHAWQLSRALFPYLWRSGYHQEIAATQRVALATATQLGDVGGQAVCDRLLASAYRNLGDYDRALGYYSAGLELYRRLGNRLGEAKIHQNLSVLAEHQGRQADALGHAEQAIRLYQAIGHKSGEAEALNAVGWCHGLLGDYERARAFCQQALAIAADCIIEGCTWDSLGYVEHHLSNFGEAADCYQRALRIIQGSGARYFEAMILTHLGDTHQAADELARAREVWQQALNILEDIQHPDAEQVRAKLDSAGETARG